jgi:hypothetical protein
VITDRKQIEVQLARIHTAVMEYLVGQGWRGSLEALRIEPVSGESYRIVIPLNGVRVPDVHAANNPGAPGAPGEETHHGGRTD